MKIPLLLGISLLATAGSHAQQPQAAKTQEAPAAETPTTSPGQTPPPAAGDTQESDETRPTMEASGQNDKAIACYAAPELIPEQLARQAAAMEQMLRARQWETFRVATMKSFRLIIERRRLKTSEYMRQMDHYHAEGEKPELRPSMNGAPYFLRAVPIKTAE